MSQKMLEGEKAEYRYYSRGDTLALTLMMALAAQYGYVRWEIVSQQALVVICTLDQWVDLLIEVKTGQRPVRAPQQAPRYEEVGVPQQALEAGE